MREFVVRRLAQKKTGCKMSRHARHLFSPHNAEKIKKEMGGSRMLLEVGFFLPIRMQEKSFSVSDHNRLLGFFVL